MASSTATVKHLFARRSFLNGPVVSEDNVSNGAAAGLCDICGCRESFPSQQGAHVSCPGLLSIRRASWGTERTSLFNASVCARAYRSCSFFHARSNLNLLRVSMAEREATAGYWNRYPPLSHTPGGGSVDVLTVFRGSRKQFLRRSNMCHFWESLAAETKDCSIDGTYRASCSR